MTNIKHAYEDEQLIGLVPPDLTLYLVKSNWTDLIVAAHSPAQAKEFLHGFVNYLLEREGHNTRFESPDGMPDGYYTITELCAGSRPTILHANPSGVFSKTFDPKENDDE